MLRAVHSRQCRWHHVCAKQLDLQYVFITAVLTVLLSYLQLVGGDPSLVLSALVAVGQEI